MMTQAFSVLFTVLLSLSANAAEKGLLPELKLSANDERGNQKKAAESEALITKAEVEAIRSLQKILVKRKGQPDEADLWFRLADLYMRRAKSGRFFDLHRTDNDNSPLKLLPQEITSESAKDHLQKAVKTYTKIETDFPRFKKLDYVFFNSAFAQYQLGNRKGAEAQYVKLLKSFPQSPTVPDALLAMGEIQFEGKYFDKSLEYFSQLENFKDSQVYPYGMYKSAWAFYNLHRNSEAMKKLEEVIAFHDSQKQEGRKVNHNLRAEALRDLVIFFGDTKQASEAYDYFKKIGSSEETATSIIRLANLYDSHGRHKELLVFLAEFVEEAPEDPRRVEAHLIQVAAYEMLKDRKQVTNQLRTVAEICRAGSAWLKANAAKAENCTQETPRRVREIAKKWWDLWKKNQNAVGAKELADLTQEVFKIQIGSEDPKTPDLKSHYAYADLLFQLGKYLEAAEQYRFVFDHSEDETIKHDSLYATLVCYERLNEAEGKESKSAKEEHKTELKTLSELYLEKFPKAKYSDSLRFKLGTLAYEKNDFKEAKKYFFNLAGGKSSSDLKQKSEDLILDILNAEKDFDALRERSQEYANSNAPSERKQHLQEISEQASYSLILKKIEEKKNEEALLALVDFQKKNPKSKLSEKAHWQTMLLRFSLSKDVLAAQTALTFANRFPSSEKATEALKIAAKTFGEWGFPLEAAKALERLIVLDAQNAKAHTAAAIEFFSITTEKASAEKLLLAALPKQDKNNQAKTLTQLMELRSEEKESSQWKSWQAQLLSLGVEPYRSKILVQKAEALLEQRKWTEAFNAAKNIVGSSAPNEIRARGRLVQARVLEEELIAQSTKGSLEKMQMVLALKTEKLDKAQTAYLTTAKIAEEAETKIKALQGLDRVYGNYIETVNNAIIKTSLTPEEETQVREQLKLLTGPIAEKRTEIQNQLQAAKGPQNTGQNRQIASAPVSAPDFKPRALSPSKKDLKTYSVQLLTDGQILGLYGLALAAKQEKQFELLHYFAQVAEKKDPNNGAWLYIKSQEHFESDPLRSQTFLKQAYEMSVNSKDTELQNFLKKNYPDIAEKPVVTAEVKNGK